MIQNPGVSYLGLRREGIVCNYNDIIALCANSADELRLVASVQTSHFLIPGLGLNHVCLRSQSLQLNIEQTYLPDFFSQPVGWIWVLFEQCISKIKMNK